MKLKYLILFIILYAILGIILIHNSNEIPVSATKTQTLYNKVEVKEQELTMPTKLYTEDNLMLLAKLLQAENGSSTDECILLTGVVVLKRVKSERYPNTILEVINQRGQYSTAKKLDSITPSERCLEIAEELLIYGVDDYPDNLVFQSMFPQGKETYKIINGEYFCLSK